MSAYPQQGKEYRCDQCGETYTSAWSEEEAKDEMRGLWGDIPAETQAVVCEDCFEEIMQRVSN